MPPWSIGVRQDEAEVSAMRRYISEAVQASGREDAMTARWTRGTALWALGSMLWALG